MEAGFTDLLTLDRSLRKTWKDFAAFLRECAAKGEYGKALAFARRVGGAETCYTFCDYPLYLGLNHYCHNEVEQAKRVFLEASRYGNRHLVKFTPNKCYWGLGKSAEFQLLSPFYADHSFQEFADKHFAERGQLNQSRRFDVEKTPFCWFEKSINKNKNVKCFITDKKLELGSEIYRFKFFNGALDIPSHFFAAGVSAFEANLRAKDNLRKYLENGYDLQDYNFNVKYGNPYMNFFWNTLTQFNLEKTLELIANPPVHSTSFRIFSGKQSCRVGFFDNAESEPIREKIHEGTGGEFLNLLYVLIKCGFKNAILELLPKMPVHLKLALMCLKDRTLREEVSSRMEMPELADLFEIALKNYAKKTAKEVRRIIEFSKRNPEIRAGMARFLATYEAHLYSNYNPVPNWFFEEFQEFSRANGGGLLEFLIPEPDLLRQTAFIKNNRCFIDNIANNDNTYSNSFACMYRMLMLNEALIDGSETDRFFTKSKDWDDLSRYSGLKKIYNKTMKIISELQKIEQ